MTLIHSTVDQFEVVVVEFLEYPLLEPVARVQGERELLTHIHNVVMVIDSDKLTKWVKTAVLAIDLREISHIIVRIYVTEPLNVLY